MGIPATKKDSGCGAGDLGRFLAAGCVTDPEPKHWDEKMYVGVWCGRAVVNLEESQRRKAVQYEKAKRVSVLLDEIEKSLKPFAVAEFFAVGEDMFAVTEEGSFKFIVQPSGIVIAVSSRRTDFHTETDTTFPYKATFNDAVHWCLSKCDSERAHGFKYLHGSFPRMFRNGCIVDDFGTVYDIHEDSVIWADQVIDCYFVPIRKLANMSKEEVEQLGVECSADDYWQHQAEVWRKERVEMRKFMREYETPNEPPPWSQEYHDTYYR